MENENAERSVPKNFSLKNRQIDFMSQIGLGSEWFQRKIDEEILSQKAYVYCKQSPVTHEFAHDNILVRTSPPFQQVMETLMDNDSRVIGHGFMMRIK